MFPNAAFPLTLMSPKGVSKRRPFVNQHHLPSRRAVRQLCPEPWHRAHLPGPPPDDAGKGDGERGTDLAELKTTQMFEASDEDVS
jgi:hypothetical protein